MDLQQTPEVKQDPVLKFGVFGAVVLLAVVLFWAFRGRQNSGDAPRAADSTAAAAAERPAPTPTSTPEPTPTPTPTPTPSPTPSTPPSPTPRPARARAAMATVAVPAPTPAETTPAPTPAATPPPPPPTVSAPPPQVVNTPPPPAQARASDPTVYDAANGDVAPPTLMTPMSHVPVPTAATAAAARAVIEIMVNGDGTVDSVRAATPPGTIGEALEMINWLSITKSWRFGPAQRNGQPVKYRLLIPLRTLMLGRAIR